MTHEELENLSKEYVDEALSEWCTENHQIVEPWHCVVEDLSFITTRVIQKLFKDYCIVPKSEVIELYNTLNKEAEINSMNAKE